MVSPLVHSPEGSRESRLSFRSGGCVWITLDLASVCLSRHTGVAGFTRKGSWTLNGALNPVITRHQNLLM